MSAVLFWLHIYYAISEEKNINNMSRICLHLIRHESLGRPMNCRLARLQAKRVSFRNAGCVHRKKNIRKTDLFPRFGNSKERVHLRVCTRTH